MQLKYIINSKWHQKDAKCIYIKKLERERERE